METKLIEVEVPDGFTAKYDAVTQTVKFVPETYKSIKDFETACKFLGIGCAIPIEIQANKQLCAMYQMQIVLNAVNQGHAFSLISGEIWYPCVRFIEKINVDEELAYSESKILDFIYNDTIFTLVGGLATDGLYEGLGCYKPIPSEGTCNASFGFLACYNKDIAQHVSKYFAPLIFDCYFARNLGFSLHNGVRVKKKYPIND